MAMMLGASSENGGLPRGDWNNGQLEIHLEVFQVALNAAEEEASAVRV